MRHVKDSGVSFHEEQRFRQRWIWLLLWPCAGIALAGAVIVAYGMVQQLVYDRPWGDRPMSDAALMWIGSLLVVICLVTAVGVPWVIHALRLVTEVAPDGVFVRFIPLTKRRIGFEQIVSCEARTYRPILEYGGWGVRFWLSGTAYNVSGNQGVQLRLASGRRLLIGSQRAEELARAIQAHMPKGAAR
jgi:hypothetical protein